MPSALIVGLDPALLTDPDLPVNERRVRHGMDSAIALLKSDGIAAEVFLLRAPIPQVADELHAEVLIRAPDVVMIGAGVRLEPGLSWLLELLVNAVVQAAPTAKLCFNDTPEAMTAAIHRVLARTPQITGLVIPAPVA